VTIPDCLTQCGSWSDEVWKRPSANLMLVFKCFKFRFRPDLNQLAKLDRWENSLRFLWNIGNEQRFAGLAKCKKDKKYPSFASQQKELTDLRSELPWLNDVPRHACARVLSDLENAWQRWFSKSSGRPKFKKKLSTISITETDNKAWQIRGKFIKFSKLGLIRTIFHRPVEGKPKVCTLKRDVDKWYVYITCEVEVNAASSGSKPTIGLDLGINNFVTDSNERAVPNPRFLERRMLLVVKRQRKWNRKNKGSKNKEKARIQLARTHRKVRRQREFFLHSESSYYANNHSMVGIENLNVKGMVKSTFSRGILDSGWAIFSDMLSYKIRWTGGSLVEVPAAYSSQTCSSCAHVDSNSRSAEQFHCTKCGYKAHADVNAAKIVHSRMNHSALPVDGDLKCQTGRSRKTKLCSKANV
jgi:putative transposase